LNSLFIANMIKK